ncbi:hypothetical protein FBQ98_13275 [Gammaproteobacteria bacterium PRO6]|nr:hypothetical protein [Gammaproteobacteria bacterium PRO6]
MQHLTIVTTGGTIDKIYFDDKSTFQIGAPQIGEILEALGVAFSFEVVSVLRKDSLHLDQGDRALIRATIERQPHRHVLVTHGTDTMVDTAQALQGIAGKVIVLTGALNPALFKGTDAVFNIGCAVGAVQTLGDGRRQPLRAVARLIRPGAARPGRIRAPVPGRPPRRKRRGRVAPAAWPCGCILQVGDGRPWPRTRCGYGV